MDINKENQEGKKLWVVDTFYLNEDLVIQVLHNSVIIYLDKSKVCTMDLKRFLRIVLGDIYVDDRTSECYVTEINYDPRFSERGFFTDISIKVFQKSNNKKYISVAYLPVKFIANKLRCIYDIKSTLIASRNELIKERRNRSFYQTPSLIKRLDKVPLYMHKSLVLAVDYLKPVDYINKRTIELLDLFTGVKNELGLVSLLFEKMYYDLDVIEVYVTSICSNKDELWFSPEDEVKLKSVVEAIESKRKFLDTYLEKLTSESNDDKTNLF